MTSPADNHDMVKRLQKWRPMRERDLSLTAMLAQTAKGLKRQKKSIGGLGAAWGELVPAGLVEKTSIVSLSRGVLMVRVDDASAKFEVDRWLKCGGETALIAKGGAALVKVRLVV